MLAEEGIRIGYSKLRIEVRDWLRRVRKIFEEAFRFGRAPIHGAGDISRDPAAASDHVGRGQRPRLCKNPG